LPYTRNIYYTYDAYQKTATFKSDRWKDVVFLAALVVPNNILERNNSK
jgi:hypothetical protein